MDTISLGKVYRVALYGLPFQVLVEAAVGEKAFLCRSLLTGQHITVAETEFLADAACDSGVAAVHSPAPSGMSAVLDLERRINHCLPGQ